ncbi:uncharacterized protein PG986_013759 [Apiospora aurea]|uniref:Uncharacterized protein n=1 Tax=Apiospora aurea TaxID=335848 RepID=A0ABR1PWG8_9PEZI
MRHNQAAPQPCHLRISLGALLRHEDQRPEGAWSLAQGYPGLSRLDSAASSSGSNNIKMPVTADTAAIQRLQPQTRRASDVAPVFDACVYTNIGPPATPSGISSTNAVQS